MNWTAILLFVAIVGLTLVITFFAAQKTKTASDFYTADGGLTGFQNGLAIAGDYMSAASFLGIAGILPSPGSMGSFTRLVSSLPTSSSYIWSPSRSVTLESIRWPI